MMLGEKDREILRETAKMQLEAAHSEKNLARVELWKRHNAFHGERPVIHLELDTFEHEVIPQRLRCESEEGRALETALYRNFLNLTLFDDDWVVPDFFPVTAHTWFLPFGHAVKKTFAKGEHAVGRVIARPFIGEVGSFVRTENRRDFSVDPTGKTMLDVLKGEGYDVLGVGKIEDIFNHRGLTSSNHAAGNEACVDAVLDYLKKDHWRGLLFANLVDTDMLYGHRNDVSGFARCLEAFDRRLPEILRLLGDDGMLIITADHGCDPAFPTTDHTREYVPLLVWGLGLQEGVPLGVRGTFADVSATVLEALGAKGRLDGTSFYGKIALE